MIGHKRIPSREGGVEIHVEEIAVRLAERGYEVTVYNRRKKGFPLEHEYKKVRIVNIPTISKKNLDAVIYSFFATLHALFGHYDVIHYHAVGPSVMLAIPHLLGMKTVATVHGLNWKSAKWGRFAKWYMKLGEKAIAKYANEVIVLSSNMQKYFAETYERSSKFVPNGICAPVIQTPEIIKNKYSLEKDGYILFLARIVPEKGLHYLLHAFSSIETEKKLVIAGEGTFTDGYVEEIKKMAAEDCRVIMTGFVQGGELEELYSNAFLYVLPSDSEGMPIGLLEAMSYGCPCLVSDIPENSEVIEDAGYTFAKGNEDDLKMKITALLRDSSLKDVGMRAQELVLRKYNWDVVVETISGIYNSLPGPKHFAPVKRIYSSPQIYTEGQSLLQSITVLTPTYNRAEQIKNLYRSLLQQTSPDFVWIVVDDGSTDNTKEVVQEFISCSRFKIRYIYKENGGKHTALNVGIAKAETPLTIIVDSDDTLLPNAIEIIIQYDSKYRNRPNLCGFSFLKVSKDGKPVVSLPKHEFVASHIECRIRNGLKGDMAEVFYSDILKKYQFPEFPGEKFLSEDIVWITIGENYDLVFVNQPIYECEYISDGLSVNDKKMKFASPYGSMLRGKKLMTARCGFLSWLRGAVIYDCYQREISKRAGLPEILQMQSLRCRAFSSLFKPAGLFFNWRWKKSIR